MLLVALLALVGCSRDNLPPLVATSARPATSSSGSYTLVVQEERREGMPPDLYFQILDPQGPLLFESEDRFSHRHTTFFLWDEADRVWVYSGDVGTYIWEQSGDGTMWTKRSYSESGLEPPAFLKEVRPQIFDR